MTFSLNEVVYLWVYSYVKVLPAAIRPHLHVRTCQTPSTPASGVWPTPETFCLATVKKYIYKCISVPVNVLLSYIDSTN